MEIWNGELTAPFQRYQLVQKSSIVMVMGCFEHMGDSNILIIVFAIEDFVKDLYFEESFLRLLENVRSRDG